MNNQLREKIAEIIADAVGGECSTKQCFSEAEAILQVVAEASPTPQEVEKRFDAIPGFTRGWLPEYKKAILDFIRSELTTAEERVKEEIAEKLKDLALDIVEPCEPDCTKERHALHEVSWRAHLKVRAFADALTHTEKEEGK